MKPLKIVFYLLLVDFFNLLCYDMNDNNVNQYVVISFLIVLRYMFLAFV